MSEKLGTDPYKGVRDFYPEDEAIQKFIFKVWRETVESFGFVQYDASPLEPAELYRAKSGEEIVNEQTYTFIDRGDREVTLRPEMTPTVARMVAGRRRELAFPLRWYSIPNVFRYERPQKGRLREHLQLNCDLFGVEGIEAEIEMISLSYRIMKAFGAKDEDFEIKVNSRKILKQVIESKLKNKEDFAQAITLLDKKTKLSREDFQTKWKELSDETPEIEFEISEEINSLIKALNQLGISNVSYDKSLIRGFAYYTGIVFEVYDTNPENNRSLFGGGRFDDLLSLFGNDKVPTVGFGMGDVTIRDFLESRNLLPKYVSTTDLYLINAGVPAEKMMQIADTIRNQGANVAVDYSGKKIGDQIKKAVKDSIPYIAVIGELELASKSVNLKHLESGKEEKVAFDKIAEYTKARN